jgi:CubicO group peptidase (beta-lactamase class C family)
MANTPADPWLRSIQATVFAAICLLTPTLAPAQWPDVDAVLGAATDDGRVAGVVALVVTGEGVVYDGAFGKRDVAGDEEMTPDSLFRVASMTKPITSVAVMQLVDAGVVVLDDPASEHVEDLRSVRLLTGFDRTGAPTLREPSRSMTVRHLLTHTAGFGYQYWNGDIKRLVDEGLLPSSRSGTDEFLRAPLLFNPGDRWEYGINSGWLGRLVEAGSGQLLDTYLRDYVFLPLGMNDTFYNVPASKEQYRATAHVRQDDGRLVEQPRQALPAVSVFSGGGGLVSSARAYGQFLRMLLNGGTLDGHQVLMRDTVDLMAENHIGELEAGAMRTVDPTASNDFDFFPDSVDRFGLGFLINTEPVPGGRAAGSLAWAGALNTYFWVDRTHGVAGVLLTQVIPFFDAEVVGLLDEFERAVYAALGKS